jgi:hypothetical protein
MQLFVHALQATRREAHLNLDSDGPSRLIPIPRHITSRDRNDFEETASSISYEYSETIYALLDEYRPPCRPPSCRRTDCALGLTSGWA